MKDIYFFGSSVNRGINKENVKNLYFSIKKFGFLPQARKIKKVIVTDPKTELYKIDVISRRSDKSVSINNYTYYPVRVADPVGKEAITDGQHVSIAMAIAEEEKLLVNGEPFKYNEEYEEVVEVPNGMNVGQFVYLLNYAKSWTAKDFQGKLSTGNQYLDYMDQKIAKEGYVPDLIYSLYALRTIDVKTNLIQKLKSGRTDKMPKGLVLNKDSQEEGDQLLAAFDENISKDAYNNGKLGKGFKKFVKENGGEDLDIDTLVDLIKRMGKDIWFNGQRPTGSPEAPDYCNNFVLWYRHICKGVMNKEETKEENEEVNEEVKEQATES